MQFSDDVLCESIACRGTRILCNLDRNMHVSQYNNTHTYAPRNGKKNIQLTETMRNTYKFLCLRNSSKRYAYILYSKVVGLGAPSVLVRALLVHLAQP